MDTATGISEQAQQLWEKQQLRLKAKAAQANNDATLILVRNTQKVVYQSLVEVRSAFNQLLQDIKDGKTPTGSALQNKTWQQAMNTVEQLVDLDPL